MQRRTRCHKKKKKNSCWCKHYAFTSPCLTSLLHSQQQAAISLVISSASSNAHLPVFNPPLQPFLPCHGKSFPLYHFTATQIFPFSPTTFGSQTILHFSLLTFWSLSRPWQAFFSLLGGGGEPATQLALAKLGSSCWTPQPSAKNSLDRSIRNIF